MIARPTLGSLPNSRSVRGQPLAILLAVLALWIGMRASLWLPPIQEAEASITVADATSQVAAVGAGERTKPHNSSTREGSFSVSVLRQGNSLRGPWSAQPRSAIARPVGTSGGSTVRPPAINPLISMAAPFLEPGSERSLLQKVSFSPEKSIRAGEGRRLSIDAWLFLRDGGVGNAGAGPLAPTYGGSQFGAVLRYDLGSRTAHQPQAYVRATGAIDSREADLAAGISIQPVPALPLRAHGEVRVSRLGERVELRPSAFITAGIDETVRPIDMRVRGYAQAGYVGGEFATGFADGSLVIERDAKRFERGAIALGVGAWGGAQKGTSRLDAGPTASLNLPLGRGSVRLAADYRMRIAGDAVPASGAALTLSTSF